MLSKLEEQFVAFVYWLMRCYNILAIWFAAQTRQLGNRHPTKHVTLHTVEELAEGITIDVYRRGSVVRKVVKYDGVGPEYTETQAEPAWWYIGANLEESGDKVDMTEEMHPYLVVGNRITPRLLYAILDSKEVVSFSYIHPKTFEEKEIDSNGLVVGDGVDTREGEQTHST